MRRRQLITTLCCGLCVWLLAPISPIHALPHRPHPLKSWEEISNYRAIADADRQLENLSRRVKSLRQIRDRIDATLRLAPAAGQLQDQRESVLEELQRTDEEMRDLVSYRGWSAGSQIGRCP
jgi:hypothetical protein